MSQLDNISIKAKSRHYIFLALFLSSFSLLTLSTLIASSSLVSATESGATAPVSLTVESVLSMNTNTDNLALSLLPSPDATLSTGEITTTIASNNATGYTLTMSTIGTSTDLANINPSITTTIPSTTSSIDSPTPLSANTWGWYPSSLNSNPGYTGNNDEANNNYQFIAIPSSASGYNVKQTSTTTAGDSTTMSFGILADTNLPAGSYTNTITLSVVANYVPPLIPPVELPEIANPDIYTTDNPAVIDVYPTTGWTGDIILLTSDAQFTDVTNVTIGGIDCNGYEVASDSLIACRLPELSENTTDGYTVAVTTSSGSVSMNNATIRYFNPTRTETIGSSTTSNITMQNFTQSNCNSMTVGQVVSLTDTRNNQTYRVKKMQDNKCWMIDNMKYLGEGITINNIGDGTTGIAYNNTSGQYNTVDGTTSETASGTGTNWDKAFYNNPMGQSYCYTGSYSSDTSGTHDIATSYTKCGYLYNWYAATAGTGTYNTSSNGTNVSGSICPTGWRLPSSYSDGSTPTGNGTSANAADFAVLNASMNAGSLTTGSTSNYYAGWQYSGAWSGVFSGGWWPNRIDYQGSNGHYWSSTAYSSTYARLLHFHSSGVSPAATYDKYVGLAVRCVLP